MKSRQPVRRTPLRSLLAAVAVLLVALTGVVTASPAQAAAFRYWGYYQLGSDGWAFSQKGAPESSPADGSVEGWRFAVADESSTRTPRVTPSFDELCAGTPTAAGHKRVGLVVDFGRPADGTDGTTEPPAAKTTCVTVPPQASGADVLAASGVTLRLGDKGLTCGIDGWPATGCGDPVDPVPAAAASPDTSITVPAPSPGGSGSATSATSGSDDGSGSGSGAGLVIGGAFAVVLVVVIGASALRSRRTRQSD